MVEGEGEGVVVYCRHLQIREATIAPEEYEALRAFLKQVAAADQATVVLVQRP
jgi:hypothetical protein